jgi:hypothetical protein
MDIDVQLTDVAAFHPNLVWDEIVAAAVAVLCDNGTGAPIMLELSVENIPNYGTEKSRLMIEPSIVPTAHIHRLRRTFEPARLVEMAAIAVAGLALYYAGGHEIRDVAARGTAADYLVDDGETLLEIAGRSRRKDFAPAWRSRSRRLSKTGGGFYLCVVEFETPFCRLAFVE